LSPSTAARISSSTRRSRSRCIAGRRKEIDYFWGKLAEGGEEGPCGWLKDRYGLSWQVVPTVLPDMLMDPDAEKAGRVTKAFLQMRRFDIAALERAYAGRTQDAQRS
jgi:predicted 3-demethylubiquinone-9 3-methyltransferase (glyoxalase superfamily)